jgi:hypothetical protein
MNTIAALPARELPIFVAPALYCARSLVTSYWRRTAALLRPAVALNALAVFDEAMVNHLCAIHTYVRNAPEFRLVFVDEIRRVAAELNADTSGVFAETCLDIASFLANPDEPMPAVIWGDRLASHPDAVYDALRFCFVPELAQYLTRGLDQAVAQNRAALTTLLLKLGVSRPAVDDGFAAELSSRTKSLRSGLAVLSALRCTGGLRDSAAFAAIKNGSEIAEAFYALALGGARSTDTEVLSVAKSNAQNWMALSMLTSCSNDEATLRVKKLVVDRACTDAFYFAAMYGSGALVHEASLSVDWSDELVCRALTDAMLLWSGENEPSLFDLSIAADIRRATLASMFTAVPHNELLRLGQDRNRVPLEQCAPLVGAPLRQRLYVEHAMRIRRAIWIDATDIASVQSMAILIASTFERQVLGMEHAS